MWEEERKEMEVKSIQELEKIKIEIDQMSDNHSEQENAM